MAIGIKSKQIQQLEQNINGKVIAGIVLLPHVNCIKCIFPGRIADPNQFEIKMKPILQIFACMVTKS